MSDRTCADASHVGTGRDETGFTPAQTEEHLPFTVGIVSSREELDLAVSVRYAAYSRHVPSVAGKLKAPEPLDTEPGTIVLLARSRLDGSPLGSMRIQTNRYRALALEQSIELPEWLQGKFLAEATRLSVVEGRIGGAVKPAVFKCFYQFCLLAGVEWAVVAGRKPLDRQYERLLFKDVYPGMGFIPMKHGGNIPHRVMALNVASLEPSWREAGHPLYRFFFNIYHPDIDPTGNAFHCSDGLIPIPDRFA